MVEPVRHKKIAIASGKGGTGKTTVAVNLALAANRELTLLDCDVEEPNAHLFLKTEWNARKPVKLRKPVVKSEECISCGRCAEACKFNAIVVAKTAMVFYELCHACGGCSLICPTDAIEEEEREVGSTRTGICGKLTVADGYLNVGEPQAPPVIAAVMEHYEPSLPVIIDAPPGTGCSAVETINNCDFALMVTEPTPFGLNDLELSLEMAEKLEVPSAVLINRSDLGDGDVKDLCSARGVEVVGEIPFDRKLAEAYSRGIPAVEADEHYREFFSVLYEKITELSK
ncbi:MAG: ATP-binding protein [Planctomycetota bacterium]|nr:ATP-binding protein [Planctomycetota bacterium]